MTPYKYLILAAISLVGICCQLFGSLMATIGIVVAGFSNGLSLSIALKEMYNPSNVPMAVATVEGLDINS